MTGTAVVAPRTGPRARPPRPPRNIGNLRSHQRVGFRMVAVDRDAFVPATGYPDDIVIDGILLRDRVWFATDLA